MDLIIVLVIALGIYAVYRKPKKVVLFFGIAEIFFRIVHFISDHINVPEFSKLINKYIPSSLFNMIGKYVDGVFYEILMWALVVVFVFLEYYLVKYFFKKGK